MKILVVDDERVVLNQMKEFINRIPGFHIVGYATDGAKAVVKAVALRPDIILMDIEMPHRDGLTAARDIAAMRATTSIVFVSALRQHSLKAFDLHAAGYLLKPVKFERLREMLEHIRRMRGGSGLHRAVGESEANYVCCRAGVALRLVDLAQVPYLRSRNKYTELVCKDVCLLSPKSLVHFERRYGDMLVRVRRDILANRAHIRGIERVGREKYVVQLKNVSEPIEISRRNASRVRLALADLLPDQDEE